MDVLYAGVKLGLGVFEELTGEKQNTEESCTISTSLQILLGW